MNYMTNTEKLSHIPVNLVLSLPIFLITFSFLSSTLKSNYVSFIIAFVIYINKVVDESKFDYLQEQINNLKNKNNEYEQH